MDGRRYVRLAGRGNGGRREGFDLAFIQQPDAWTAQINRFYTREFFLDLRRILAPDGVVALRLASAENYASEIVTPYTAAICKTLATVFPAIALSPGMTNFIFASGAPASVSQDPVLLARRYRAIAPAPARLSPVFASLYPAEKAAYLRGALTRSPIPSLNSDDRPIAYFLGSRLLGWSTGSPLTGLFAWFAGLRAPRVFLALGLLFLPGLLWILWRRGRPSPFPALLAAACGGFAGLSFEVTAIFIFQSAWGFAYGAVGMLIALFMLGLGAGAVLASKWAAAARPGPAESAKVMAGIMLLVSASAAASLFLFPAAAAGRAGQVLLAAWLGWTGLLCGTILPLGLRALARHPAGRAAGWLNAGDYLGGAAGSVLMAAFFLPLLGTRSSLALLALAALAAAAALAIAARTAKGESRP
jgi:spermidine synthase